MSTLGIKQHRASVLIAVIAGAALLGGCVVGPKYKRPSTAVPPAYKEPPPEGWKEAQPADGELKGKWWEVYNDPALNTLEEQVGISNQNVLAAEASYREAKAAARVAHSALFPTATAGVSITESRSSFAGNVPSAPGRRTIYSLPVDVSYEPDLWGRVRRSITAGVATAQATAAQLENIRLLYQADLAQDYFQLHSIDTEKDLLSRTVASYQEYLQLTRNRFAGGVASDLDVAQAESQLYGVQAQLTDLNVQRAALEHAIAILTGKAPAEVTVPAATVGAFPPPIPVGIPSAMLERRPDVAAAERSVAAANEEVGITKAAFFPVLTLSSSVGLQASSFAKWLGLPSRFWSVGPALAETLFDGGRRRGQVAEAQAAYDALVADYRQTVLAALGQVEDNLAALRYFAQEATQVQDTVAAAERSLTLSTAQYKAGTTSYLQVITAQAAVLQGQRTAVQLLGRRLVASVSLIEALGGGWTTAQLPSKQQVLAREK
jgi:NodT family efflux transporter outer membrane factor (OMF) lipoprotein